MKKSLIAVTLFSALASQVQAEPAVYQDQLLSIDEAVVIREDTGKYFRDVRFEPNPNGTWRLTEATPSQLAGIEEITVVAEATVPAKVEVTVNGYKSLPCVDLEPLGMSRSGDTFHVVIAETALPPYATCIAMIDPFTQTFELDTFGLEAGTYKLNVNGMETEFDLLLP